jgi:hypothetical protein
MVEPLWSSDQLAREAVTSTTHKKTMQLYAYDSIWIRILDPREQPAGDLILRPLSHRDRRGHIAFCHCICAEH